MRDFNFFLTLEKSHKTARSKRNGVVLVFSLAVLVVCVAFAVTEYIAMDINLDVLEKKRFLESGEIAQKSSEINEKKQIIDIMNKYLAALDGMETSMSYTFNLKSSFIDQMNSLVPAGVSVSNVEFDSVYFKAQYTAVNKTLVAEMYRKMLDSGAFDSVYIPTITKVSDNPESYSFSLECALKGGAAK